MGGWCWCSLRFMVKDLGFSIRRALDTGLTVQALQDIEFCWVWGSGLTFLCAGELAK